MDHVFIGAVCTFCGADDHDVDLPEKCDAREENERVSYSSDNWHKGLKVTEEIRGCFTKLPNYPLLPDDLLVKEADGSFMKVCPGLAVGGCHLTPEQEASLVEVEYQAIGLEFICREDLTNTEI